MREPLRLRAIAFSALLALALPAHATAHGRGATIALDYRLILDPSTLALPSVRVRVLDGDRDLQVQVRRGVSLLVRGALGEPMLRVDWRGVWVNASSPTATADGIVSSGKRGWVRVSRGGTFSWHDHRLSPPPASKPGIVGHFSVPVDLNGSPAVIAGVFVRVARPALWPWAASAGALVAAILVAMRRRSWRGPLTLGLGGAGGVAALTQVTTFAIRDTPSGGVGWLQIGASMIVGAVLGALVLRLRGRARVRAAGAVGAVAAAVSLGSLSIYWHGVVISLLPGTLARAICLLALLGGAAAAALSFLHDFDEPVGTARRGQR